MVLAIILVGILFVCVVVLFLGSSSLFRKIEASYKRFLEDKENYSDTELKELRSQLTQALDELNQTIPNREQFIESNFDPQFSEYAGEVPLARQSLVRDKQLQAEFKDMLQEVEREIARREHSRKYK